MKYIGEQTVEAASWQPAVDLVAHELERTAVARDRAGGTALHERRVLRESGLLGLSVPRAYGGHGANWSETLGVVRRFAQVDSSLAHLFAFHHLHLATVRLFGQPQQWQPWLEQTIERHWFWGNALNPLDQGTRAEPDGTGGWVFAGRKSFCSGASDSDRLLASAFDATGRLLVGVVPTAREGIEVLDDWDNMGQRQTDSGTVLFEHVAVAANEILADPGPLSSPFACLRPLLAQLILAHIYLGLGEGAIRAARDFTRQSSRPWVASSAARPTEDLYVQGHYGRFWLALEGARALVERAATAFDAAWKRDTALTESERGKVALAVAAAKVSSAQAGLDITQQMFEVTGARDDGRVAV